MTTQSSLAKYAV